MPNFELKNDNVLLLPLAPGGKYSTDHLKKILQITENNSGYVKICKDQQIGIVVHKDSSQEAEQILSECGLQMGGYIQGTPNITSCLGNQCPQSKAKADDDAVDLSQKLNLNKLNNLPLSIGINGCELCCEPTHTNDISLVAGDNGYQMYLGGKQWLIPECGGLVGEEIPTHELPKIINKIIDLYISEQKDEERIYQVKERLGSFQFANLLGKYSSLTEEAEVNMSGQSMDSESSDDDDLLLPDEEEGEELSLSDDQSDDDDDLAEGLIESEDLSENVSDEDISDEDLSKNIIEEDVEDDLVQEDIIDDTKINNIEEDVQILEDDEVIALAEEDSQQHPEQEVIEQSIIDFEEEEKVTPFPEKGKKDKDLEASKPDQAMWQQPRGSISFDASDKHFILYLDSHSALSINLHELTKNYSLNANIEGKEVQINTEAGHLNIKVGNTSFKVMLPSLVKIAS